MKTQIFYFSGTGNSLAISQELTAQIPDSEVIPIVSAYKSGVREVKAKTVGFVFPVHAFSLPKLVEKFIRTLSLDADTYIFAMATRGGSSCRVFEEIDKILSQKGLRLQSYSFVEMPNNYLTLFGVPTKEQIDRLTSEAQKAIEQMSSAVKLRKNYQPDDPHYSYAEKNILFPLLSQIHKKTRFFNYGNRFYADSKCNGCSICSKVCLSGRIQMENGRPGWDKNSECFLCLACIHYCPCQAVQLRKTKTPKLGRYHHPKVTAVDIMAEKR